MFDHEPTRKEILWAMSQYGCSRGSVAIIRKGYWLDVCCDDGRNDTEAAGVMAENMMDVENNSVYISS